MALVEEARELVQIHDRQKCIAVVARRDKPGGSAIALVQVDQPISLELLGKIAAVEGVVQAKVLGF